MLADLNLPFDDPRLPEMLFRYRARNWPETLSAVERERWNEYRLDRLRSEEGGGSINLEAYRKQLARLMVDPGIDSVAKQVLSELADWPMRIGLQ